MPLRNGLGWASHLRLCASVTKQYILAPAKGVGDLFGWESNRGKYRPNGSLPTGF